MRTIIFTAFLSILLVAGCGNDKEENFTDELIGSCWHQDINEYQSYTFYFAIDKECTVEWKTGIGEPVKTKRKYEYKHPNITITLTSGSGMYATGYIENEIMYLETETETFQLKKIR